MIYDSLISVLFALLVLAASEASKSQSGSEAYNPEEPSIDLIEQPAKSNVSWVAPTTHSVSSSQTRVFNTFGQFPPTTITGRFQICLNLYHNLKRKAKLWFSILKYFLPTLDRV